ncbi:MAG: class I SAM-dependent methyltransferase [Methanobacteriaceae archaeon]|nr:class I SAM-dependent methyltransferase [Methanobacteriaceae archaeon]
MKKKDYGKSQYYQGSSGEEYFKWQNAGNIAIGLIESRKFSKYIKKDEFILDFGCGGGHTLAAIECKNKYGIEINPSARKEANKYGFPVYEDLSSIEESSIDKAISNHCLEHVPYPIEALKQIRKCLKDEGELILCLPIDDWRNQKQFNHDNIDNHLYTWTPQLIGNCLLESDYKIKDIKIYTHAWPPKVFYLNKILPVSIFDFICKIYGFISKRRQIIAVAKKY